jgi:hypothetical protein
MKNRTSLSRWLYDIHNKVNKKLEVKEIPTFEEVTEKYEGFRSKCTHKSPDIIEKVVKKGCTNPSKEGSLRKKCELVFYDVDEHGNRISNFGKRKSSSFGSKKEKIKLVSIKRSTKSDKKLMATFETNGRKKVIHFGARGYSDYSMHKNKERRQRYIKRHSKDLGTGNPARAGYLSMFVLWNKPTVGGGIADYRRRLGVYNRTGKFPTKIS